MSFSLEELARFLSAEASHVPGPAISGAQPIEYASAGDITYVQDETYLKRLPDSACTAVIIPMAMPYEGLPHIRSRNPEADFARITALFYGYEKGAGGVSPKADISNQAQIGKNVSIGPYSVVGPGVVIGDGTVIESHVALMRDITIGRDCRIFPHVVVYPHVRLGDRVIIHSGTVIGADGFGFARDVLPDGTLVNIKKYHHGSVSSGDDVEIGALCAIDRGFASATRLGNGVKLDNLVQVAHNCEIGDGTVIAAQAGIAGSSAIGKFGVIGGQAGVRDHVKVGDGVILATRVGIYRNVPSGSVMAGSVPAMPHKVFLRAQSLFKRLPEIFERVRKLEAIIHDKFKDNT